MKSELTRRKALVGLMMLLAFYITIFVIVPHLLGQTESKEGCVTVQGHIERIVYFNDTTRVSLVEVPNHIYTTGLGYNDLSAFTMRMLMAGDGRLVEICSVQDRGIYERIVSGRLILDSAPTE